MESADPYGISVRPDMHHALEENGYAKVFTLILGRRLSLQKRSQLSDRVLHTRYTFNPAHNYLVFQPRARVP